MNLENTCSNTRPKIDFAAGVLQRTVPLKECPCALVDLACLECCNLGPETESELSESIVTPVAYQWLTIEHPALCEGAGS